MSDIVDAPRPIDDAEPSPGGEFLPRLRSVWERVFARSPIGLDEDFFELGGDSLVAAILFVEIEREFHRSLPLTTIYEHPTIAKLAAALADEQSGNGEAVVLFKEGNEPPLFIVHGIGGSALELAGIANSISAPVAVYGIGARGLADGQTPRRSLADMAVAYNAAIRDKQPGGPYRLAGYSFGGIVAHEMARRLQQDGCEVSLLALIDSYDHPEQWPLAVRLAVLRQRLRHRAFLIARDGLAATLCYVAWRVRRMAQRRRDAATGRRVGRFDEQADLPPSLRNVRDASELALLDHRPGRFAGRIDFISAQSALWFPPDPRPIWQGLAEELAVATVPGGHFELADTEAAGVGLQLSILLERTDPATKSSRELLIASSLDAGGGMTTRRAEVRRQA